VKVDIGPVLWTGRELVIKEALPVPAFGPYVFEAPAQVWLEIGRLDRQLAVTGVVDATYVASCARCLDDTAHAIHIDVEEQFPAESSDPFAESNVLDGTMLDVGDLVRQLLDSALPMTTLCSEDCPGLCSTCGQNPQTCRCAPADSLEKTWPT
jgi:uncharacterized metal-binding protein YceD (DUF177 family)